MPTKDTLIREVRLTNTLANHNKFYEMLVTKKEQTGATFGTPEKVEYVLVRRWGRIGAKNGESDFDDYATNAEAQSALEKVKRTKLAKGYVVEWDRSGVPVQAPKNKTTMTLPLPEAVKAKVTAVKKAKSDELPKGAIFDRSGDDEAKSYNKVAAKRKEESEW